MKISDKGENFSQEKPHLFITLSFQSKNTNSGKQLFSEGNIVFVCHTSKLIKL